MSAVSPPNGLADAIDQDSSTRPRGSITWRSLLLGTAAVIAVCGITPYNDFQLSDTSLVAGYLPLAAVLILFVLIVGINAPLHRWARRHALNGGELAVIMLMVLVACSLPNWGLMRFFIPTPVAPFKVGADNQPFWRQFIAMDLPGWLFPVSNIRDGRSDPIVQWFYNSVPPGQPIPFGAWLVPLLSWGIFIAAMFATLAAIARMVIAQWMTNERLPFPIVQVQAALLESPPPGAALNDLFRSRLLWFGIGTVFVLHSFNCLNYYFPKNFPKIPLGYDFRGFISWDPVSGEPLSFLSQKMKMAAISFIVIGVTYFIRSKVAFSLWGIFVLVNMIQIPYGMLRGEMPPQAWQDQHLGASVAFVGAIIWIGREHWLRIVRNALGAGGRDREYRWSFWIAIAGILVMCGWLRVIGVHLPVAITIVAFIVTAHLVVSRVLAETGIPFYRSGIASIQVFSNMPVSLFNGKDIYFAQVFSILGPMTTRDGLMSFTMHGLGLCRTEGVIERERKRLGAVIAWTLLIGFAVAAVATLYCQYSYPTPASQDVIPARNWFGAEYITRRDVAPAMYYYGQHKFMPKQHNSLLHMGIGFVTTLLLEIASLRWASWPLLPVGYVVSYGAFVGNAWLSIFIGWVAKVLIVRFGGASLFQKCRPLFIGIIFGEALAAGFWLVVNGIIVSSGGSYLPIKFLF